MIAVGGECRRAGWWSCAGVFGRRGNGAVVRWCGGALVRRHRSASQRRRTRLPGRKSTPFAYMPGRLSPRGELRRPRGGPGSPRGKGRVWARRLTSSRRRRDAGCDPPPRISRARSSPGRPWR